MGDRSSIVSTRRTKYWDNLSRPWAERVIPLIFMRIHHISKTRQANLSQSYQLQNII
jgi:hypothetical protein